MPNPTTPNTKQELREKHIKVQVDYAPKENGKAFQEWCKKYDFDYLASGRRAWCGSLQTYFRGADGVAFNDGEMFLFYDEDSVDMQQLLTDTAEKAEKDGFYAGQANAGVSLEDCHKNYEKWAAPNE